MLRINSPAGPLRASGKIIRAADYASLSEAAEIIAQARHEADEIRQLADKEHAEEKKRGFAEGTVEALSRRDQMVLETTLKGVEYLGSLEHSVGQIVIRALERILGEMDQKEMIFKIVHLALQSLRTERRVEILVHPSQTAYLQQRLDELRARYPSIGQLEPVPDASLAPSGCILRSDMGTIDASLETQLASIRNALQPVSSESTSANGLLPKSI